METPWILLVIGYVFVQASAMAFLYLTLVEVLRRMDRMDGKEPRP